MLAELNIVAFTHQSLELADVGQLVIPAEDLEPRLSEIRHAFGLSELFYIGTCNRVEVIMMSGNPGSPGSTSGTGQSGSVNACDRFDVNSCAQASTNAKALALLLNPALKTAGMEPVLERLSLGAAAYSGERALEHLVRVSCSLESMVVGEKEILAQVRAGYETCRALGFCGDLLRLVMECVVKASKEVYTHTRISEKPISVVSLAYRKLKTCKISLDARILVIGAGKTNSLLSRYLFKHGYRNFTVFSRNHESAKQLAESLKPASCTQAHLIPQAHPLDHIYRHTAGFDLLLICTSSTEPLLSRVMYSSLLAGDQSRKIIIDLGLPGDVSPGLAAEYQFTAIDMPYLQTLSRKNLEDRYSELAGAEKIIHANLEEFKPALRQRRLEIAMRDVPVKIKEIRERATESIFARELEMMDENSRQTLEKVLNYMEKKYISVPMVMAREIMSRN